MRGTIAAALILVPTLLAAQDVVTPTPRVLRAPTHEVPAAPGGWILEVTTTGGVLGTGAGIPAVTITSDGQLTCAALDCARTLDPGDLRRLEDLLGVAAQDVWPLPLDAAVSLCRDCLRTVVTVRRREDGVISHQASWDVTRKVAPALRALAAAALRLATVR